MPRKKKISFRLNPEWLYKEPVDFEYNKYTLLDYLQKCEKRFDNFEIYPDFVELSLHLANLQSLMKENTMLLTDKKFEYCDDEILLKELFAKKPPKLEKQEQDEIDMTVSYSTKRVFDTFNIGKSIWNIVYDNVQISLKKNKENIDSGYGYVVFFDKEEETIYLWQFYIKKDKKDYINHKTYLNLIYKSEKTDESLSEIISKYTTWKENDKFKDFPIFEVKCPQKYPMNETFVPMIRRKVSSYVFQITNLKKIQPFDLEK